MGIPDESLGKLTLFENVNKQMVKLKQKCFKEATTPLQLETTGPIVLCKQEVWHCNWLVLLLVATIGLNSFRYYDLYALMNISLELFFVIFNLLNLPVYWSLGISRSASNYFFSQPCTESIYSAYITLYSYSCHASLSWSALPQDTERWWVLLRSSLVSSLQHPGV